jgi:hypothetical protein
MWLCAGAIPRLKKENNTRCKRPLTLSKEPGKKC